MHITKSTRSKALALLSILASPAAFAHTGHGINESVHGLLHAEHVVAIAAAGIIALAALSMRDK